jgi:hypothetical protein
MEVGEIMVRLPSEEKLHIFSVESLGVVGPTQPHIQWGREIIPGQ